MRWSWWNQDWNHQATVGLSLAEAHDKLLAYYKKSSPSFTLEDNNPPSSFSFQRGYLLVSMLGLGSELWLKHFVDVEIERAADGESKITWHINLKVFGLQVGSNAIIDECEKIVEGLA
ncbi:MAG: hypothetical protein J3T61_09560 [Candidatus Brocadiales bacterium]|nr:hypothetical protein [Candidatus Bathyanammoxibius sp.]